MSRTKNKEQIYKEIIQEIPDDLNEKELAAFIMKKIANEQINEIYTNSYIDETWSR